MNDITVYSKDYCPYCTAAKALLSSKGLGFTEFDVGKDAEKFSEMSSRTTQRTVPQIFFGAEHIGGYTDLYRYFQENAGTGKVA